jgi:hypothetical protein
MRRVFCLFVFGLTWGTGAARGDDWKPASGPLMTAWAKDVSPTKVHADYPRPQMIRPDWVNLNGLWQFAIGKKGETPPIGKDLGERILVPFPVESALSGIMKRADRLWYRRTFTVPPDWSGRQVLLRFGAVDWETTVWVNGVKIGEHRGGYDAFHWDITHALKPAGAQEMIVGVWDPTDSGTQPRGKQVNKPGGIYYTPTTGIWQTVWLEPVPAAHIEHLKIVPDVDAGQVLVTVTTASAKEKDQVALAVKLKDKILAKQTGAVGEPIAITIPEPRPWTPEEPFLYDLDVVLVHGNRPVDGVQSYFGLRKIAVGTDDRGVTRILLNGKPYFQVGPLDQGFWPDGLYTAPTDEALRYDIEVTKKLGFNMTRKHVKVEPDRWYYWCDKLGLLVWQDMPSGDKGVGSGKGEIMRSPESARQYELELRRMIDGLYNHPSIIMWVVFNEGWGQFDTKRITNWTKQHDPTRLVNCASGWNDVHAGDVHDMHKYPGPGSPDPEPRRAAVLGEFGGLALGVDGHTWTKKTWGYQTTQSGKELTGKYERLLSGVWQLKAKPGLSAAVYTQLTDVETEANGLLTYDRAVIKVDAERVAAVNRGDLSRVPQYQEVVPTARKEPISWRYTLDRPASNWFKEHFEDAKWKQGPGGFGTRGTPGAIVRTEWKTDDIWLRREFSLNEVPMAEILLAVHHDEDVEVYINGVLVGKASGFTTDYVELPLTPQGRAALKTGKNVFAVHCHQTTGGQYIDVGLVVVKAKR